jgi:hypothetical protein
VEEAPSLGEEPLEQEEVLRKDPEQVRREEDAANKRRFIYQDVEELLTEGFLSSVIHLPENTIVIRTMNPSQMRLFKGRLNSSRHEKEATRWFIASSVWMIDGLDVTGDVNSAYHIMREWLANTRQELVDALYSIVIGLRKRFERALDLVECFCYEPYSRSFWRMASSKGFTDGEDNNVRKIWVAHNLADDEYYRDLKTWEHTKAQVASMTGKGAQHLTKELKKISDNEEERRRKHVKKTIDKLIFGEYRPAKKVTIEVGGKTFEVDHIESASSFDELEDEMARFIKGEKDAHDVIVDEYFRKIRERQENLKREYEEAVAKARESSGGLSLTGSMNMVGYTAEQLKELGVSQSSGVKVSSDSSPTADHLYNKIISEEIKPGWLSTAGVPEKLGQDSGTTSLQGKIQARKPSLDRLSGED